MADYFLSDVHLRLDQPDRGQRLARLVDRMGSGDTLTIVGDLCDFWFVARQIRSDPMSCQGLRALASFRERGGPITILAGNHDAWIGPFYERTLGARFIPDTLEIDLQGIRTFLAHGHRLGAQTPWKEVLKSRFFLGLFRMVPGPLANALGNQLRRTNSRNQEMFDRRGIEIYREFAGRIGKGYELIILGHVHLPIDTESTRPRLVVLGGWYTSSCYLVVEDGLARHVVEPGSSRAFPVDFQA